MNTVIWVVLANRQQIQETGAEGIRSRGRARQKPCKVILCGSWFRNSTGPRKVMTWLCQMPVPGGKPGKWHA